ncbi:MAG: alpha/beta hydrolase [Rhodocyclaceae bacterium]|nr:alpha/beta hydrolase [Rhodocyclaceae bacterium]
MDLVNAFIQPLQAAAQAVRVENLVIRGFVDRVQARLYRPAAQEENKARLPAVLYFHGGGFVAGTLDDAEVPARYIAEHAHVAVLSVAYSLAPTRPFPAAPEDAYAASVWLLENAKKLKLDPECIAVAGDDAGGNIAAALALIARDRNAPEIVAQVLIGPMLDPSMTKLGDADRLRSDLKPETCADCYSKYLPRTQERLHPYASPLESRRLRGLPPALMLTAECDVLHKEGEQYAAALINAGVPTQVQRFNVRHAELHEHTPLLEEAADFLRRHLHNSHNN